RIGKREAEDRPGVGRGLETFELAQNGGQRGNRAQIADREIVRRLGRKGKQNRPNETSIGSVDVHLPMPLPEHRLAVCAASGFATRRISEQRTECPLAAQATCLCSKRAFICQCKTARKGRRGSPRCLRRR